MYEISRDEMDRYADTESPACQTRCTELLKPVPFQCHCPAPSQRDMHNVLNERVHQRSLYFGESIFFITATLDLKTWMQVLV